MADSTVAARIKRRLDKLGIKPETASKDIGRNRDYVRNILRGKSKNPQGINLISLSIILKCSAKWLIDGTGPEERAPSDEENELLTIYRTMSEDQRAAYLTVGRNMAPTTKPRRAG